MRVDCAEIRTKFCKIDVERVEMRAELRKMGIDRVEIGSKPSKMGVNLAEMCGERAQPRVEPDGMRAKQLEMCAHLERFAAE